MKISLFGALSITSLILLCPFVYAGNTLTKPLQSIRNADTLYKIQVEYKDPGRTGTDVLWDFSTLKINDQRYKVRYFTPETKSRKDSVKIYCLEHQTIYKYIVKGDSILYIGFENAGSVLTFSTPQTILQFPFSLGDSINSFFLGTGSHNHTQNTDVKGKLSVIADATGTLFLPNGDTVYNVLRVKSTHDYKQRSKSILSTRVINKIALSDSSIAKISKNKYDIITDTIISTSIYDNVKSHKKNTQEKKVRYTDDTDSLYFRTETCRWYAQGYRYPIFETIRNFSRNRQNEKSEKDDIATAFYFPPSMHTYLKNDPLNRTVIDSLKFRSTSNNNTKKNPFNYNIYPNPVKTHLNIDILLQEKATIKVTICSLPGHPELDLNMGIFNTGLQTLRIELDNINAGYHIIQLHVNGQAVQDIIKKIN